MNLPRVPQGLVRAISFRMSKNLFTVTLLTLFCYPIGVNSTNISTHHLSCTGSKIIDGTVYQNATETLALVVDNDLRNRSSREPGKSFGALHFSKSTEPIWGKSNLSICYDDVLNFNLDPVCIRDSQNWPVEVGSIYRKCTLNKVSLKFDCHISVRYKENRKPRETLWDYECSRAECIMCK